MPHIAGQRFEALEKGLSRASVSKLETGYENLLAELFGLDIDSTKSDVPTGAILARKISADTLPGSHYWLRAVPVNLVPDRDRLLLHPMDKQANSPTAEFTCQISDELLHVFNDLFAEIFVNDASGWLFRLKRPAHISTSFVNEVSGKSIQNFLPAGDEASQWIAVFNEIQMILHAADSSTQGFNALWFEGGGSLPEIRSTQKVASIGDEKLLLAVADYCQAESLRDLNHFRGRVDDLEKLIFIDMNVHQAINKQSEELLQQSMQAANDQFSQLLSLLDEGQLSKIHVYLLNGSCYSIGRTGMLDFLKRSKTLSQLFVSKKTS